MLTRFYSIGGFARLALGVLLVELDSSLELVALVSI